MTLLRRRWERSLALGVSSTCCASLGAARGGLSAGLAPTAASGGGAVGSEARPRAEPPGVRGGVATRGSDGVATRGGSAAGSSSSCAAASSSSASSFSSQRQIRSFTGDDRGRGFGEAARESRFPYSTASADGRPGGVRGRPSSSAAPRDAPAAPGRRLLAAASRARELAAVEAARRTAAEEVSRGASAPIYASVRSYSVG